MGSIGANGADTVAQLTKIAYDFGPFLFAIMFLLVVTRTAHKYYYTVNSRTTPPATGTEAKVYMVYFVSSYVFGILLVSASVAWWLYSGLSKHVLEITIRDVPTEINLVSDDAYARTFFRQITGEKIYHVDYYFAFIRSAPFKRGDIIWLKYWKSSPLQGDLGEPKVQPLEITYDGDLGPTYEVEDSPEKPVRLIKK